MDEISDVDAQTNLSNLLDQVEQGREVIITRTGKAVARLKALPAKTDAQRAAEDLIALRSSLKERSVLLTIDEIIAARDEGRR